MRRVPAGSFHRLSDFSALWAAWQSYRRGKRRRPAVAAFDMDADLNVLALHRDLRAGRYSPSSYRVSLVRDPKTRLVAAPALRDRVLQRAVVDAIAPVYERGFIDHSYAVRSERGPHRAMLAYLGWMRRYRFRLHLDIRHYFASIDHGRLLALLSRRLADSLALELIAQMLEAGGAVYRHPLAAVALGDHTIRVGCGLPLGGYLSHWSGGLYLDGLDHHVKRFLKVPGYLRYMDDFVLFMDSATRLEEAGRVIAEWLRRERGLTLKDPDAAPIENTRPAVFVGFRVSRAGVGPGPRAQGAAPSALAAAADADDPEPGPQPARLPRDVGRARRLTQDKVTNWQAVNLCQSVKQVTASACALSKKVQKVKGSRTQG